MFMTGLGIKGNRDNVPLFRDISCHLPDLLTNGLTPVNLSGLVIFWYPCYKVLEIMLATDHFSRCDNHNSIFYTDIDLITDIKLRITE